MSVKRASMAKETMRDKIARLESSAEQANVDRELLYLTFALGEKPLASRTVNLDGEMWVFDLYGIDRAHGGILALRHTPRGSTPSLAARYFERYAPEFRCGAPSGARDWWFKVRDAIEELWQARAADWRKPGTSRLF